ncbi:MAG: HAD family acid phosphatase [Thermoanaerobaculia bacterium]
MRLAGRLPATRHVRRVTALLALALAGCAGSHVRTPNLPEVKRLLKDYVESGRYQAEIAAVDARAAALLAERARGGGRLAIVLDIDETALSNLRAIEINDWGYVRNGGCDLDKGPCGWIAWQELAAAPAIAPTLELARAAGRLGVAVFFVTGRQEMLRPATEKNLRQAGYVWEGLAMRPTGTTTPSAVDLKAPERRKIESQGYTIVLCVGDQRSDLDGGSCGATFLLPNPFYLIP